MRLSVTTPQGALVETEVDEVTAPGALGEFGVLPGHVPFLSALQPGVFVFRTQGREPGAGGQRGRARGGPRGRAAGSDKVIVLVSDAVQAEEIDREAAEKEVARADSELASWNKELGGEYKALLTQRAWAAARIAAAARALGPLSCASSSPAPGGPRARCAASWSTCACAAPRGDAGGVSFEGQVEHALRVCLWSRVGMRVLLELGELRGARRRRPLPRARGHRLARPPRPRATPWRSAPPCATTRRCRTRGFAALKVKDALVDALRDRLGARPDVDPTDPDVRVVLHLQGTRAQLYLDLVGRAAAPPRLPGGHDRGPAQGEPGRRRAGAERRRPPAPFCDPMAGSGTLAIEQALRARGMAPGLNRRFGFERWPGKAAPARLEGAARPGPRRRPARRPPPPSWPATSRRPRSRPPARTPPPPGWRATSPSRWAAWPSSACRREAAPSAPTRPTASGSAPPPAGRPPGGLQQTTAPCCRCTRRWPACSPATPAGGRPCSRATRSSRGCSCAGRTSPTASGTARSRPACWSTGPLTTASRAGQARIEALSHPETDSPVACPSQPEVVPVPARSVRHRPGPGIRPGSVARRAPSCDQTHAVAAAGSSSPTEESRP